MYQTTIAEEREINSYSRQWNLIISDQYGHIVSSQDGGVISLYHCVETTSRAIVVGDIITQNLNIELKLADADKLTLTKNTIISVGYEIVDTPGVVPMGKFRVLKTQSTGDSVQITLKDFFYGLDQPYESYLTYPTSLGEAVREIGEQLGWMGYEVYFPFEQLYVIETASSRDEHLYEPLYDFSGDTIFVRSDSNIKIMEPLHDCNIAQALSYYAGLAGFMLTQDRSGRLTCVKPSKSRINLPYRISRDKADEPQVYNYTQDIVIKGLRCIVDDNLTLMCVDNTLDSPDFKTIVMEFSNPLMTQEQLEMIAKYYIGLVTKPALIEHRLGDPRLDVMDRIEYETGYLAGSTGIYDMIITSLDYNFDGGLRCTVQSPDLY